MLLKFLLIFCVQFYCSVNALEKEKARFDNYRVYELNIENDNHLELMKQIDNYPDGYRLEEFSEKIPSIARLIVPPHNFGSFSDLVEKFKIKSRLVIKNLQEVLDNEQPRRHKRSTLDWTRYWDLNEINGWLESLTVSYPNDVTLLNIGFSYEGRSILGVKLNIGGGTNKKSVMLEGTHHSREWLSAATLTWSLNELLTSSDPEIQLLANNYEWYIFPVTNPDGYLYSWTTDRLWRKNRKPTPNPLCFGANPNRNWDNFFNQGGTSMNPCSDIYAGEYAFSEPETRVLADFIKTVPNLAVYIPFHTFGQILMLPYGWTHELLENYDEIYAIGEKAVATLTSKYGTQYRLGAIANVLYIACGASIDWVKYELKVNVTMEYEMRDTGLNGFVIPAAQIIENADEVFASLVTILQEAQKIGIAYVNALEKEKARFDNYRVYELNIENDNHLQLMKQIDNYPDGYRLEEFSEKIPSIARLIVPPHNFGSFSDLVEKFEIKSRLLIKNLQEVLDNEQPKRHKRSTLDWTRYWDLNEINGWLESLTVSYPNDVTLLNIGFSYEGRSILGVKLNVGGGTNKKSVMLEGTHHAREWLSAATLTWSLNELLTSSDPEIQLLANNYEWYIFPVTNPDGYLYSWTTDRLWRKTRKPTTNPLCYGTDPNRNWDNFFNQGGTSMNPCSNTYAGEYAFSEPETRILADFIKTVPNLAVYIPFHTFGQILMLPYGWTHELLENYDEIYAIGEKAVATLTSKYGTQYRLGAIANILYIACGASIDWVKYELKVNVTMEYEMRDTGLNGFVIPAAQIIENADEVFASLVTILQEAQKIGIA